MKTLINTKDRRKEMYKLTSVDAKIRELNQKKSLLEWDIQIIQNQKIKNRKLQALEEVKEELRRLTGVT